MYNRYEFRTYNDVPGVYEVIDNTINKGFNNAVAVFGTKEAEGFINCYCGFENPKQYRSFNSWAKDIKKMFGVTAEERIWDIK